MSGYKKTNGSNRQQQVSNMNGQFLGTTQMPIR